MHCSRGSRGYARRYRGSVPVAARQAQCARSTPLTCPAAGWHSTPAGASDRRAHRAPDPCSGWRSCWPVLREMPNSRHTSLMPSPSRRRATKRKRSSVTNTPPRHQHLPPNREKCYPCVRYSPSPISQVGDITYLFRADCTASAYCAFCYLVKAWQRRIRPPTAPPRIFVIDEHACPRRNRPPSKP